MSSEWSRRQLLGLTGMCVIAGCSGVGDSSEPTEGEMADDEADADGNDDNGTGDEDANDGGDPDADEEPIHAEYETTTVEVESPDGTELGSVTAAIAETSDQISLGLSDTEELPSDRGMLFVFDEDDDRLFYMRDMDFGIDIIYADSDGTITQIHNAPEPGPGEDGTDQLYPGWGQYVLEVVYEWTDEHDVSEGDVLQFDLDE